MSWKTEAKVQEYVGRVARLEARRAGEVELAESLPTTVKRCLDLGAGDGRLTALVSEAHPELEEAVLLDNSEPMLRLARTNFHGDGRITIREHDLTNTMPALGAFDAIVSGFAIHHLPHRRKRALFAEVVSSLRPGGVFINLEVVQCATPELHEEFNRRIERPGGDPEDVLAGVEEQLGWMRESGLTQVDCNWRWRGFALLVGQAASRMAGSR